MENIQKKIPWNWFISFHEFFWPRLFLIFWPAVIFREMKNLPLNPIFPTVASSGSRRSSLVESNFLPVITRNFSHFNLKIRLFDPSLYGPNHILLICWWLISVKTWTEFLHLAGALMGHFFEGIALLRHWYINSNKKGNRCKSSLLS